MSVTTFWTIMWFVVPIAIIYATIRYVYKVINTYEERDDRKAAEEWKRNRQ